MNQSQTLDLGLKYFFALSPDLLCVATLDGYAKHLNPAWETTLGFSIEELLSVPLIERVHPEDREKTMSALELLTIGEPIKALENRYLCKDGSCRWFVWNVTPSNQPNLIYAIARDITEQKRAEVEKTQLIASLKESEERWHLALRGNNDGIWDWNTKTNGVFFSPRWKEMLGYDDSEIPNHADEWAKRVHPDDIDWVKQALQDHLAGKTSFYQTEHRVQCKDGSYKWILARAQALWDETGTAVRMVGSHTDITESKGLETALKYANEKLESRIQERTKQLRKAIKQLKNEIVDRKKTEAALQESESRLNSILNYLRDTVWSISATTWELLYLNSAVEDLYGYPYEDFRDNPHLWSDRVHPEDRDRVTNSHQSLQENGYFESEYRIIRSDGEIRWVQNRGWAIRDETGTPTRFDGIVTDITERKLAEKTQARLTAILEATTDFVGTSDVNGNILYINRAGRALLGIGDHEEISQLHLSQLNTHEKLFLEGITTALQQGIWTGETTLQCKSQSIIPVSQVLMAHKGENGEVEFLSTIARDIREQKSIEVALRCSEELYRALARNFPNGAVALFDQDLRYILCDGTELTTLGLSKEQTENQTIWQVWPGEICEIFAPMYRAALAGNTTVKEIHYREQIYQVQTLPVTRSSGEIFAGMAVVQNITERKQAEDAVRESETQYRRIVETATEGIWMLDSQGQTVFVNPQMSQMLGYGVEEMIGQTLFAFMDEQGQAIAQANLERRRQGISEQHDFKFTRKDGSPMWAIVSANPIFDRTGQHTATLGMITDITERKQAEQALQNSEARYRQLAQQEELINRLARQIRNSLDVDTILGTVVQEIQNLLGIDRCNFIWYRSWPTQQICQVVKEAKQVDLPSFLGQHSLETNALSEPWLKGQIICIHDLQQAADPIWKQVYQRWSYTALLTLPIPLPSGDMGLLNCGHHSGARSWQDSEVELLKAVGDQLAIALFQAELYTHSLESAQQAQEKAEQLEATLSQLQQTQAQLIQTEKMSSLGQLVAGLAHEINNPVNFIYGNLVHVNDYIRDLLDLLALYQQSYPQPTAEIQDQSEVIELDFLLEDLPKLLNSMKVGADRIRQIVLSLRNFSRLDEAEMKPVDIHEGIDNTLLILQNRLKPKGDYAGIEVIKAYGKLPLVECYPGQLNQVFMNILANAIDALEREPEPRTIKICTELAQCSLVKTNGYETFANPNQLVAVIRIFNSGPEIPAAAKNHLFEPFFTTKPVGKGTGLGLAISYQIVVEKHGGILQCFSEADQGTEFRIEIPISQTNQPLKSVG